MDKYQAWKQALIKADGCQACAGRALGKFKTAVTEYLRLHPELRQFVRPFVHWETKHATLAKRTPGQLRQDMMKFGGSMAAMARAYGVSRQRVHQLFKKIVK